jgi:hypothetical protein
LSEPSSELSGWNIGIKFFLTNCDGRQVEEESAGNIENWIEIIMQH